MTNYNSKLKGWSVDRVIELAKAGVLEVKGIEAFKAAADELADYAFVPKENLADTVQELVIMIKEAPAGEAGLRELITVLESLWVERVSAGLEVDDTVLEGVN